jgi:hypothetical protein
MGALQVLYEQLAPRLATDSHRQLLRELLIQLSEGGGEAVQAEIRARMKLIESEEL